MMLQADAVRQMIEWSLDSIPHIFVGNTFVQRSFGMWGMFLIPHKTLTYPSHRQVTLSAETNTFRVKFCNCFSEFELLPSFYCYTEKNYLPN